MSNPSGVSSRFVSQTELTEAQQAREELYRQMGQEPPADEGEYDPRPLAERLRVNAEAKQEKYDEMFKLSNQFRGIDEDESHFLADVARQKAEADRRKRLAEQNELEQFRRATAKEQSPLKVSPPMPKTGGGKKRKTREGILGVVRKKPAVESKEKSAEVEDETKQVEDKDKGTSKQKETHKDTTQAKP